MRVVPIVVSLLVSSPAYAASTLQVGGGGYTTLSSAIAAAAPGDTVLINPGTWAGGVTIDKDLTIAGVNAPVITGNTRDLFVVTSGTVVLSGLTLHPTGGRGVRVDGGHVSLVALTIEDNTGNAFDGAGVRVSGASTVDIVSCVFRHNENHRITIIYNVEGYGGHLYVNGASRADTVVNIDDTTFSTGAAEQGGAIYARRATVVVTDSVFTSHVAKAAAGTLRASDVDLTLDGVDFSGGRSTDRNSDGATLYLESSTSTLTDVTVTDGRAARHGGALYVNGGSLSLSSVSLTGNRGAGGAAGYVTGAATLRVQASTSCGNTSTGAGGAWSVGAGVDAAWARVVSIGDSGAGGFLSAVGAASVAIDHADVLDAGGSGAAIVANGGAVSVRNTLVAWSAAQGIDAPGATVAYDAFFANTGGDVASGTSAGAGLVLGDPRMPRYLRDGVCGNDDVRVQPGSPLIDAGDPTGQDPDGTQPDIGVIGGSGADPDLFDDDDSDGTIEAYDCNDLQPFVGPGSLDICDGLDNDCDGVVDGPSPVAASTWYTDADADGWGLDGTAVSSCEAPPGTAASAGDCDDQDRAANPGATEICDGIDNDCVGGADGADAQGQLTWYPDADGDGHGSRDSSRAACSPPAGFVLVPDDCDDTNPDIAPGIRERCDGVDEDCDTVVDSPNPIGAPTWTWDDDGDGFGSQLSGQTVACTLPEGYARESGDCEDGDPDIHPRAPESCDLDEDTNCDGFTGQTDHDDDGVVACEDCDDGRDAVFPGAPDTPYDGVVTDCDSLSDFDADRDGYESIDWSGDDCDDADASIAPGLVDAPDDGVDQDCSGEDAVAGPDPGSCGCQQGGVGTFGVAWLACAVALRRRRT